MLLKIKVKQKLRGLVKMYLTIIPKEYSHKFSKFAKIMYLLLTLNLLFSNINHHGLLLFNITLPLLHHFLLFLPSLNLLCFSFTDLERIWVNHQLISFELNFLNLSQAWEIQGLVYSEGLTGCQELYGSQAVVDDGVVKMEHVLDAGVEGVRQGVQGEKVGERKRG